MRCLSAILQSSNNEILMRCKYMEHKKYYRVPDPIINKKEQESLKDLTARYEKLSQPNAIVGDTRCQERKTADKENKHQMKVY